MKIEKLIKDYLDSTGSLWMEEKILLKKMDFSHIPKRDLYNLLRNNKLTIREMDGKIYYSFSQYSKWETEAAKDSIRILKNYNHFGCKFSEDTLLNLIAEWEKANNIILHEQQREAVICAVRNGFSIITGGPGTGKTSVLNVLTYVMVRLFFGAIIKFAAPTGRAASRITESTGWCAKTIQKELKITKEKTTPDNFYGHILIVDEVSMMDMETCYKLLSAIQNGQKVIFCGDINQLPSVGPGAILRDLLFSGVIPSVMLTKTFRQKKNSTLLSNIKHVENGEFSLIEGDDFKMIEATESAVEQLLELYLHEVEKYGIHNTILLLPYRKVGELCSNNLNSLIQAIVNPQSYDRAICSYLDDKKPVKYFVGDPVIQLENREECSNGDVGIVTKIDKNQMTVDFGQNTVIYSSKELPEQIALAYAISINKSQGSEYKSVIVAMTEAHKAMLNRNTLYTAITRAKVKCTLLYEESACMKAIYNDCTYDRITFFAEELVEQASQLNVA